MDISKSSEIETRALFDRLPKNRVGKAEISYVNELLEKGFSNTEKTGITGRFEKAFAEKFGVQYAISFNSGTSTMHACLLARKAASMIEWDGRPRRSKILKIKDSRLESALDYTYKQGHGIFDFTRSKLPSIEIFVHQLAFYYATLDVLKDYNGDFIGIKCQDELSGLECTQCISAAYLNNDVGPDGKVKNPIPVACENDMDSSLTQLLLYYLNGKKPAGFGDFRDIENNILAIVNCGQHPPYFFGSPDEDSIAKLARVEYIGQEVWYNAGGASVRGRTPGGQIMTVARLYRENLRYAIAAMVVETVEPDQNIHSKYSYSWPVILARTPIRDDQVIDLWPCNHLGFTYGDFTPHIVEMAERLNIGYTVYDFKGNIYKKES